MDEAKTTLDQLMPGQVAKVKKVGGKGAVRRRLMDMGVISGTEIVMVKASPFGDPVEYKMRGYSLSLRKSEAQMIEVTI